MHTPSSSKFIINIMKTITILLISLAATTDYNFKFSCTTSAAAPAGATWAFSSYSNAACTTSSITKACKISDDSTMMLSSMVGFSSADMISNSNNMLSISQGGTFTKGQSVGFTMKFSCTSAPGSSMTAIAKATSDGTNYDVFPSATVTLTAGVGHMAAFIGLLVFLLIMI